jgi:2,3-bisphosphoglycerate-independent phosphoglycerate mutase
VQARSSSWILTGALSGSGDSIKKDNTVRFTEIESKKGKIGLLEGSQVVKTGLELIKSQM